MSDGWDEDEAGAGALPARGRIVCVEGPSAVGKTALATALAEAEAGGAAFLEERVSPEPPPGAGAAWWVARHVERWGRVRLAAASAPLVAVDGDPFKGLWYNPAFADQGWDGVGTVAPHYESAVARGDLEFPDLYVLLEATPDELRARRDGDATRTRRNHELHLRLVGPLREHFAALSEIMPGRVLMLDTTDRASLVPRVRRALAALPAAAPDPELVLSRLVTWARGRWGS